MSASPSDVWTSQRLSELLAAISACPDHHSAAHRAIECAAESLDAEVCAFVSSERVVACIGFPEDETPDQLLLKLVDTAPAVAELPGLGVMHLASAAVDQPNRSRLLVGRRAAPVTPAERVLLQGMLRVLDLAAEMLSRQQLLERVSDIQRQIVRRAAPRAVLRSIVESALELTGSELSGLRHIDPRHPDRIIMVATSGFEPHEAETIRYAQLEEGVSGRAITADQLVTADSPAQINPATARLGVQAAMACPVHVGGEVIGALVVGSKSPRRVYSASDRNTLQAFAQHASLALTDAQAVEDAMYRSVHDALTDLPNRVLFADRLDHALRRAERDGTQVAVLFMDLDRFKNVNDSLGHAAGDELLIQAARRLTRCIRPGDTAARFGGDEFAILIEDADAPHARLAAQRILEAFEQPFRIGDRPVFVTASIGIAAGRRVGDDPLRDADLAMYRAKASGKGTFELFEPAMHEAVVARLEMEGDLKRAEDEGQLLLHYQPIVDLRTGRVSAVEALVRWSHPRRGLICPDAFLPLAQEIRQMPQLGRWVLEEACRQAVAWRSAFGVHAPLMNVNLSAQELAATDIVQIVEAALAHSGLPAEALVLEITETMLMHDVPVTVSKLAELKALGVRLAVDDFGTGYSSLQYLRRFPIDVLKMDKTFVDDLGAEHGDAMLARAIIDLGERFGLRVIAEGIERDEQREQLLALGCTYGQGHLFSRAVAADDAGVLLAAG